MTNSVQRRNWILNLSSRAAMAALTTVGFALVALATQSAQAQTYQVIHNFTENGQEGFQPMAGLAIDGAGNLYGTTNEGIGGYYGSVFKLAPKGQGWFLSTLHRFHGGSDDGDNPQAPVVFGPDGGLYGTTTSGGTYGAGIVYNLRPPVRACVTALCPWTLSVLYSFNTYTGFDAFGSLLFDAAGNIYGTTAQGGANDFGVLYELTLSNGSWTFTPLHNFAAAGTEGTPSAGVIPDQDGNLYGTTSITAYEFTTAGEFQVLHDFTENDGYNVLQGVTFDKAGNLYGVSFSGGPGGGGTVFQLADSNGSWTLNTLHSFNNNCNGFVGSASPVVDAEGNLYGTSYCGGAYGWGSVFKLTPSNGGWTYTSLHDFCAGGYPCSDGCLPWSNVVFDRAGNLYGTASGCGKNSDGEYGPGVVWEITP